MGRVKDQLYPGNNKLMSGMLACVPLHCCGQGVLSSLPVHSLFFKKKIVLYLYYGPCWQLLVRRIFPEVGPMVRAV